MYTVFTIAKLILQNCEMSVTLRTHFIGLAQSVEMGDLQKCYSNYGTSYICHIS